MNDVERETRWYVEDDDGDIYTPDGRLIDPGTYNYQFAFNRDLVTFSDREKAIAFLKELDREGLEAHLEEIHPLVIKKEEENNG